MKVFFVFINYLSSNNESLFESIIYKKLQSSFLRKKDSFKKNRHFIGIHMKKQKVLPVSISNFKIRNIQNQSQTWNRHEYETIFSLIKILSYQNGWDKNSNIHPYLIIH